MYLFYLTLKTGNCIFALGIFVYSIALAVICPALRRREKYLVPCILCFLPAIAAFVHWGIYGNLFIHHFKLFYLEAFIPVLFIFKIKSASIRMIRSVMVCLLSAVLCFVFISMIRMSDHILQMTQDSLRVSIFPEMIMVCP